nr:WG repeat-containing protein [Bacteroidales bacterium]
LVISPKYDDIIKLSRGFLVAKGDQRAIVEAVDNFIIGLGTWQANPEYLLVAPYDTIVWNQETGYFEVTREGKYGLLDVEGKEILPCQFDEVPDPNAPVEEEAPAVEPAPEEAPEGVPEPTPEDKTEEEPEKTIPTE